MRNAEGLFWVLMQMATGETGNSQSAQSLGELGGHVSGSPGDFDPNDNDDDGWLDNVRQEGNSRLPDSWGPGQPSKGKGQGWRWADPDNPSGNYVRIDKGNPYSSDPVQQVDHVHIRYNGQTLKADGSPVPPGVKGTNLPETHIPLNDWLNWTSWFRP